MTRPRHQRVLHHAKKILVGLLLIATAWVGSLGISIWHFGAADYATQADCIIILGAAIQGNLPTPVFAERIRHGVNLYHEGLAPKVIFTGGFGEGQNYSESHVGAMFAGKLGVPTTDILIEERSHSTLQNFEEALEIMEQNSLNSAIVVSDPLHMKRAMRIAKDIGIESVSSPTPTSRYRSLKTQLGFLMREIYFFHHYLLTDS